jgi:hypothetical protein
MQRRSGICRRDRRTARDDAVMKLRFDARALEHRLVFAQGVGAHQLPAASCRLARTISAAALPNSVASLLTITSE